MKIELPELGFAIDALEPLMSRETLELHHGRHHATYVEDVKKLLPGTGLDEKPTEEALRESLRAMLRLRAI